MTLPCGWPPKPKAPDRVNVIDDRCLPARSPLAQSLLGLLWVCYLGQWIGWWQGPAIGVWLICTLCAFDIYARRRRGENFRRPRWDLTIASGTPPAARTGGLSHDGHPFFSATTEEWASRPHERPDGAFGRWNELGQWESMSRPPKKPGTGLDL